MKQHNTDCHNSPMLIKGGIVLLDPETVQVKDVTGRKWGQAFKSCMKLDQDVLVDR